MILRVAAPLVFKGPCLRLLVWARRRGPAPDDRVSDPITSTFACDARVRQASVTQQAGWRILDDFQGWGNAQTIEGPVGPAPLAVILSEAKNLSVVLRMATTVTERFFASLRMTRGWAQATVVPQPSPASAD
jgi:hypothetical protein